MKKTKFQILKFTNLIFLSITVAALSLSLSAQDYTVTNSGDDVNTMGTLRFGIANATNATNTPYVIDFDQSISTISIDANNGSILIDNKVITITANNDIDIDGGTILNMFEFANNSTLNLNGLSLFNSQTALKAVGSNLNVDKCNIHSNSSSTGCTAGIEAINTNLTVTNSAFYSNTFNCGPSVAISNFIANTSIRIYNTTFDNNTNTLGFGGALNVNMVEQPVKFEIEFCTFTRNSAGGEGQAIWIENSDFPPKIKNTIVYGNNTSRPQIATPGINDPIDSEGYNVFEQIVDGTDATDIIGQDPQLATLVAPAVGVAYTPISSDGSAFDASGDCTLIDGTPAGDGSNGVPRPSYCACDIGAAEFFDVAVSIKHIVKSTADSGLGSLRDLVACAASGDTITFDHVSMGNGHIALSSSISLDKNLIFLGIDSALTIIDGINGNFSLVSLSNSAEVEFRDMSFINGGSVLDGGAISTEIQDPNNPNKLIVVNCLFMANSASRRGGAIDSYRCTTTIVNSKFLSNNADFGGAVNHERFGNFRHITITNCLLEQNHSVNMGSAINISSNSSGSINNCTIINNTSDGIGAQSFTTGSAVNYNSDITLNNSIFYNNTDGNGLNRDLSVENSFTLTANNNLVIIDQSILDNSTPILINNIQGDPLFVDQTARDYTLQACSPAVDAGDQTLLPTDDLDVNNDDDINEPLPIDLAGAKRVTGNDVDMGAYEYSGTQVCNYTAVTCGTQLTENYCYVDNDNTGWLYKESDETQVLGLMFTGGTIQNCCDEIRVYDGPDNTAPLLFQGSNGGTLTGLVIITTQPYLYMEVDSDSSVSCDSDGGTEWTWTVDCPMDCTAAMASATTINIPLCSAGTTTYDIDVNISSIGSGQTYTITNNVGLPNMPVTAIGMYTMSNVPLGSSVKITIEGDVIPFCNVVVFDDVRYCIFENACPDYQDLTGDYIGTGIFSSANNATGPDAGKIISDQIIKADAMLDYNAGKEIILNSTFEVEVAAVFHAYIDGCTVYQSILSPTDAIIGGQIIGNNFEEGMIGFSNNENTWFTGESPQNAIDGSVSKYLNFGELNTGFIVTPAQSHSEVIALKLWTANDAIERDPTSYELYGINSNTFSFPVAMSSFTLISSGVLNLPDSRSESDPLVDSNSFTVGFPADPSFTSYLVVFPTVKDQSMANSMQIGEVQIFSIE